MEQNKVPQVILEHAKYIASGNTGMGFFLGEGDLNRARERVMEAIKEYKEIKAEWAAREQLIKEVSAWLNQQVP